MFTLTNFNLPYFILSSMIMPREKKCVYTLELSLGLKPISGKESFGYASINKMFLPRNDFDKIMHGESKAEEETRLKKTHHEKIPGEKRKKADIKRKDTVPICSEYEERTSKKPNKKEYIKLKK